MKRNSRVRRVKVHKKRSRSNNSEENELIPAVSTGSFKPDFENVPQTHTAINAVQQTSKNKNNNRANTNTNGIDESIFGPVSNVIIFDDEMQSAIEKKVHKLHKTIDHLKESRSKLFEKNQKLLEKIYQLEENNVKLQMTGGSDPSAMNQAWLQQVRGTQNKIAFEKNGSGSNQNDMDEKVREIQAKSQALVSELQREYVDTMQNLQEKQLIDIQTVANNENDANGNKNNFQNINNGMKNNEDVVSLIQQFFHQIYQTYLGFVEWTNDHLPFNSDIKWVAVNYGTGISAFFRFYRFTVINAILIFFIWTYFIIRELILYGNDNSTKWDLYGNGSFLPNWTLFSQIRPIFPQNYSFAVICTMILLTLTSISKWISENNKQVTAEQIQTSQNGHGKKFSELSFNFWNYNVFETKKDCYEQSINIAENFVILLSSEQISNLQKNRSRKEKYILYCRRTIGILLNVAFVGASWIAIFFIIANRNKIILFVANLSIITSNISTIVPSILITLVGLILPTITYYVTRFEQWDDELQTLKNETWRLYAGRILNLIVTALQFYSLHDNGDAIVSLFDESVNELKIDITNTHNCIEDKAAEQLFILVLTDFFLPKMIKIGTFYTKEFLNKIKLISLVHAPYNVAESIIEILYSQGLIWITLPIYPYLAVLTPFIQIANFKFEKIVLHKLRDKPDASSWKEEETGAFFIIFYNLTLALGLTSHYFFLNSQWPCWNNFTSDSKIAQGPFSNIYQSFGVDDTNLISTYKPWDATAVWMQQRNLNILLNLLTNAVPYMISTAFLYVRGALIENKVRAKIALLTKRENEIKALNNKMDAQRKRIQLAMQTRLDRKIKI